MTEQPDDREMPAAPQAIQSSTTACAAAAVTGPAQEGLCAGPGWMLVAGLLAGLVAWFIFETSFPFVGTPIDAGNVGGNAPSQAEAERVSNENHVLHQKNSVAAGSVLGALAGLIFSVVEALRRPRRWPSLAVIAIGVLLAAGSGALAGFAAQEFHEAWRLNRTLEPMQHTMAMQGIFWGLLAAGLGLGLGSFAKRFRWVLGTVLQAVMSMVAFAAAYVMLAGFLFPIDDANRIVPASSGNRALWCLGAMTMLGLFLGLARQRRKATHSGSVAEC